MTEQYGEWTDLVADWGRVRVAGPELARVHELVERQRRRLVASVAVDVLVTVAFIVATTTLLARAPGPATQLLALDVGMMLVAAWAFAIWSRRGTWRPLGESTADYLAIARLRCQRRLLAVRFVAWALVAQVVVLGAWLAWGPPSPVALPAGSLLHAIPWVVFAGFVGAIAWLRWQSRRELRAIEELAATLDLTG